MRYLVVFFFLLTGCTYPEERDLAEAGIYSYLSKHMHDFRSYEPLELRSVDSVFKDSQFVGYSVFHAFREKNEAGEYKLNKRMFQFDKDFKVTSMSEQLNVGLVF